MKRFFIIAAIIFMVTSSLLVYFFAGYSFFTSQIGEEIFNHTPNNSNEYYDTALKFFNEDNYEEAIKYSELAIFKKQKLYDSYNIKALSLHKLQRFEEAVKICDEAIRLEPKKEDAYNNKGYSLNALEKYEEAIRYFDKAISINPNDDAAYNNKGNALYGLDDYEGAILCYDKQIEINPDLEYPYYSKGMALYYLDRYNEALPVFDKYLELLPCEPCGYISKANCLLELEDYDEALILCDTAIIFDAFYAEAYNTKGEIYYQTGESRLALEALNKAIEISEDYYDAYINKMVVLFDQKDYEECINFGQAALKVFPDDEDIVWKIADCYYKQGDHQNALEKYNEVLQINSENAEVTAYVGWEYYWLEDYDKASEYAAKALNLDNELETANNLTEQIADAKRPDNERLVDFVKENYLYIDKVKDFERVSQEFLSKEKPTTYDIVNYIDKIKVDGDIFTYVVYGNEYDYMLKEEQNKHISFKEFDANTAYIKIDEFTSKVASEFKKMINSISDTQNKNLIIDLRDNLGGMIDAPNDILDFLLPECATSFMIYRNGYIDQYYSDKSFIEFKKIIVLVNENSASSSELLTLGLKKYLNNVVILGQPTVGKGVGQHIFENKSKKYMVFLVNFYWNVKEQNIMGSKIYPDILVNGDNDSNYFDTVSKALAE